MRSPLVLLACVASIGTACATVPSNEGANGWVPPRKDSLAELGGAPTRGGHVESYDDFDTNFGDITGKALAKVRRSFNVAKTSILDAAAAMGIVNEIHKNNEVDLLRIIEHRISAEGDVALITVSVRDKKSGKLTTDYVSALKKGDRWIDAMGSTDTLSEFVEKLSPLVKDASGHFGVKLTEAQKQHVTARAFDDYNDNFQGGSSGHTRSNTAPITLLQTLTTTQFRPVAPSHENCKYYLDVYRAGNFKVEAALARSENWRSRTTAVNQYCACKTTADHPRANIVRGYLQARYKEVLRQSPNKVFSTDDIQDYHIDAYREAGCRCGPAPGWAWEGVTSVPFATGTPEDQLIPTCGVVDLSIRVAGSCDGCYVGRGWAKISLCSPCSTAFS